MPAIFAAVAAFFAAQLAVARANLLDNGLTIAIKAAPLFWILVVCFAAYFESPAFGPVLVGSVVVAAVVLTLEVLGLLNV